MSIRTRAHRAAALVAGGALVASGLGFAGPAPVAHAADVPAPEATAAAAWLDGQLVDGLLSGSIGQTLDFGLSLLATGTQTPEVLAKIDAALTAKHEQIASGSPVTAATVVYFQALTGGADSDLLQIVADNTDASGRFMDGASYQQVWAVSALREAGHDEADQAALFLIEDQCDNGAWSWNCDEGFDYDTTARAVLALIPSEEDPDTPGASAAITNASAWLASELSADGAIGKTPFTPLNVQTTGQVAYALGEAGRPEAAKAAAWVARHQLVPLSGCPSVVDQAEQGAIAYKSEDVAFARADGEIASPDRSTWTWAGAQGLAGLAYLAASGAGKVTAPTGYVRAGTNVTVNVSGLRAGQPACLAGFGNAKRIAGPLSTIVKLPATTGNRVVVLRWIDGSATTTIKALGAKSFSPRVASARVRRGGLQTVRVTGLARWERFSVRYAGRTVRSGTATSTGIARATFRVGRVKGLKSVVVLGQFSNRRGSTTFRVVR